VQYFEDRHRLALFGRFPPRLAALVRFAVESLRNAGWPPRFAQRQNFHLKFTAAVGDLQEISDLDFTGRFYALPVRFNPAKLTATRGK